MVHTRNLWTAGPNAMERLTMVLRVLVVKGNMGGVGGTKHAAEGGGLSTGQGAHRGDRGGGTVLVKGSLGVK